MDDILTRLHIPHLEGHALYVGLFKEVSNAAFLRQQLVQGNTDFEYAFLDATSILSLNHLYAAIFRAINDSLQGRLKSRNVHSEIVFSLHPNNNIAESFRRFGVSDSTTSLLAVKVIPPLESDSDQTTKLKDAADHLQSHVLGKPVILNNDNLWEYTDIPKIQKIYKISNSTPQKPSAEVSVNGTGPDTVRVKELERIIIGMMTIKGS